MKQPKFKLHTAWSGKRPGPWKDQWADASVHAESLDDFDAITEGVPMVAAASNRRSQIANMSHEQLFHLPNPHAQWRQLDAEGDEALTTD